MTSVKIVHKEQNGETVAKNTFRLLHDPIPTQNLELKKRVPARPLGNTTIYSANRTSKGVQKVVPLTTSEIAEKKYSYKKENIERKKKIGKKVNRVGHCGVRPISKGQQNIDAVLGESGNIYYHGVMRCGSVWFCPDCMYKIMKVRADELYNQLQAYKKARKTVLFITFTLQHNAGDSLANVHEKLLGAFNYANSNGSYKKLKKQYSVEFLRVLEVLKSLFNGWNEHLHTVFIGDPEMLNAINVFIDLYKQNLSDQGLLINEHTVVVEKWNGKLDEMTDYLFKGMLEKELTGASMKTSNHGKTFFELVDDGNDSAMDEYIKEMKGKHQYYPSRGFFKDVRTKTDEEILKDDKTAKVLFSMPRTIYNDVCRKGIALHLLNEYIYGGKIRAIKLLELYDCDTDFMAEIP